MIDSVSRGNPRERRSVLLNAIIISLDTTSAALSSRIYFSVLSYIIQEINLGLSLITTSCTYGIIKFVSICGTHARLEAFVFCLTPLAIPRKQSRTFNRDVTHAMIYVLDHKAKPE